MPGMDIVLYDDDFFERVVNVEKRIFFLVEFFFVGNGKSRLNIISSAAFVADKIHLRLFQSLFSVDTRAGGDDSDIDVEFADHQFVVDDVFHDMIFFLLAKIQPAVAKPYVGKIIFERGIDVLSPFYVKALRFRYQKGFLQIGEIGFYGGFGNFHPLASEGVRKFFGVGQRAYGGGKNIYNLIYITVLAQVVPFDDVIQIDVIEHIRKIADFLLIAFTVYEIGKSAVSKIVSPSVRFFAVIYREKFRECKRIHLNDVAAPAELGAYIGRQKFGIAARDIDIDVLPAQKSVQDTVKFYGFFTFDFRF